MARMKTTALALFAALAALSLDPSSGRARPQGPRPSRRCPPPPPRPDPERGQAARGLDRLLPALRRRVRGRPERAREPHPDPRRLGQRGGGEPPREQVLKPVSDLDHWGVPDRWDLAEEGGRLRGLPAPQAQAARRGRPARRAMRMTVVIDEKGEGHAVLTLVTDRGDFVLDNKVSEVLAGTGPATSSSSANPPTPWHGFRWAG